MDMESDVERDPPWLANWSLRFDQSDDSNFCPFHPNWLNNADLQFSNPGWT